MTRFSPKQLFKELRRRRVFNTVAIYIVGAWVVLQAADLAFPGMEVPEYAIRYVWIAAFALFPLALIIGWRYDISATGLTRTLRSDGVEAADTSLQQPDRWLIGVFATIAVAVITVMGVQVQRAEPDPGGSFPANSIAVMPFESCGSGPEDVELAGGIRVAVIDRLAARERLKVTGRNSMYNLAGAGLPLDRIFDMIRVQYLLSGELCRDGVDLVLRAELMDRDQALVWSGNFRQVLNRFDQVEEQLATLVANGVALELGDVALARLVTPVNARALEKLRVGQYHREQGDDEKAEAAFAKALEYEPDYAEAVFELALVTDGAAESNVGGIREALPIAERALALARAEIKRSVTDYKPHWVIARILMALSYWEQDLTWRTASELSETDVTERKLKAQALMEEAEQHLRDAIRLNPSEQDLRDLLVDNLRRQGATKRGEVLEILQQGRLNEPFNEGVSEALAQQLALRGQYRQAMEELKRFETLGRIPNQLRFVQLEMQNDYGAFDDKLDTLIDTLKQDGGDFSQFINLYWIVSNIAYLGLYEEAEYMYLRVAAIEAGIDLEGWRKFKRQFFLLDKYRQATGWVEEVARERLQEAEGMSNEEILDRWYLRAEMIADSFWIIGERERCIEIFEGLQHYSHDPVRDQRGAMLMVILANGYVLEGRAAEAIPVLDEAISYLEAEVDAGVRHPGILGDLATAYLLRGREQTALNMLDMAIDYGAWGVLDESRSIYDSSEPWSKLQGNAQYEKLLSRTQALKDQQAANIRSMLTLNDMDALLQPVIEVHQAAWLAKQEEQVQ